MRRLVLALTMLAGLGAAEAGPDPASILPANYGYGWGPPGHAYRPAPPHFGGHYGPPRAWGYRHGGPPPWAGPPPRWHRPPPWYYRPRPYWRY